MENWRRNKKRVLMVALISAIPLFSFQNCTGFSALELEDSKSSIASPTDDIRSEAAIERFKAAKATLQANCTGCHFPGGSAMSLIYETEDQYKELGLVTAGNLGRSKLIYRLQNYPEELAGRNMPPSGPLSSSQYDSIRAWVLGMPGATSNSQNFFTCNSTEAPDTQDAKRLSKTQLYNSLHGILSRAFGASAATTRLSGSASFFTDRVPNDSRSPYSRSDTNFEYLHAKSYFDIADELATWIVDSSRYSTFVGTFIGYNPGACSFTDAQNLNATCRTVFLRNFLVRVWGRPMEEDNTNNNNELSSYNAEFQQAGNSSVTWVNNVIFKALTSPSFLMTVNPDITLESGDIYRLSDYAMARRLSLNYMQSGLDEGLLAIVQNASLTRAQKFSAILDYTSSRSEPTIREFTDDWLKLYRAPAITNQGHAKFQRIANGVNLADANLVPAMRKEVQDLMAYLNKNGRPVAEALTSNISFAQNANLRLIYGQAASAPAWNATTETNAVRFPATERSGVMTRAGFLLSGGITERLIIRGVHVRDQILCLEMSGAAPPNANTTPLPTTDSMTTRQKYETVTSTASCMGCHSQINPAGFAFSEYNPLGGFQTQEPIFNSNGEFVRNLAVNNHVDLRMVTNESKDVAGGVEYSRELSSSADFKRCISQTFYSHFNRLPERTRAQNSCTMQQMYRVIEGGGTWNDFIRAAAAQPQFQLRKLVK